MSKRHKTSTGALPHSAGFPGTNLVSPRPHPAINHINATPEALKNPAFIAALNELIDRTLEAIGPGHKIFVTGVKSKKLIVNKKSKK